MNTIVEVIDKAIKEIWIEGIQDDYEKHRLLKEDCLKNCFYYHLRQKLGDDFLENNRLQIFTEFNDGPLQGTGKRADVAIVQLEEEGENGYEKHLRNYIKEIIAIIELKHKASISSTEDINKDYDKLKEYIKVHKIDCQYYTGVIHEVVWEKKNWLDKRATNNWAKGKVTELVASYNADGEMQFDVFAYNNLNTEL